MVHAPLQYTGELFIIWFETFFGKWEAKILRPHYIILYNKIKPRKFEVCNRQCFKSRFRMNQDSMGSVVPDPDPSWSKWFLKIGQKQRNILFEELAGGVSLSQECEHLSCWGVKKYLYVSFLLNFFPIFVMKTMFYGLDLDPDLLWSKKRLDPYGIWIQQNVLIRIETQWIYTEITNNEKLLRWNFDIRNFVPVLGKIFGKGIFSWKYQPWLLGIG
jgi:hypothetical protein